MYKSLLRPLFFLVDPEKIHHLVFALIKMIHKVPGVSWLIRKTYQVKHASLEREVFGIKFPNPVGLAAGFDKDAKLYDELGNFGFGFIEIGTITPLAQDGNPKPRMFRLPKDSGLINRMGFNNGGMEAAKNRLRNRKQHLIVGGNIGKNKNTPNEQAYVDYELCFETLFPFVDYFVVNVSSPNTPNLRALQDKGPLTELLQHIQSLNKQKSQPKPILLKIAPDLGTEQLDDIIEIMQTTKIAGLIATNTTLDRSSISTHKEHLEEIGAGGLSGKPLSKKSTEIIRYLHRQSKGAFPIIGVGGIHSVQDALEKLEAGASLLQLYTGFIYEGPALVRAINKALIKGK